MKQSTLADGAEVSVGAISHFEKERVLPSDEVFEKICNTLRLSPEERSVLQAALTEARTRHRKKKPDITFAAPLKAVLGRLQLRSGDLVREVKKPDENEGYSIQLISSWIAGTSIPSKDALSGLEAFLREKKATRSEIRALHLAHLRDTLSQSLEILDYLSKTQRQQILAAAVDQARLVFKLGPNDELL